MAVTWTLTAGEAITRALRMLGNLEPPWVPSDDQMTQGIIVSNGLLKGLAAIAPSVFRQTPTSLTVTAGVATVAVPNDVMGIEEARWVVSTSPQFERPMGRFQWVQYWELPTKDAPGAPTIFMFDYQRDSTQLYTWPVSPASGTIKCTTVRRATDITLPGDSIDLPSEWMLGWTYMLADALMEDQGVAAADPATAQRIAQHSVFWHTKLADFDRPTSVFVKPWGRQGAGRFWR